MIGSLITRVLVLIFGYVYPAYECFKSVEMNKPDIDQLRFWCQYWILVAGLTVCERIGDMFIGWVPMYGEAKLAFFIYLWFPKTKGTTYVYDSFFKPYVSKHETEIDRNLLELRIRAGDMAVSYWQKAASYSQTRIFEVLQYIASQSTPRQPTQPQQTGRVQKSDGQSNRGSAIATQLQNGQPSSSPASNASSSEDTPEEGGPSEDSTANATPTASNKLKTTLTPSIIESKTSSISGEGQVMEIDSVSSVPKETAQPSTQEILSEDAIRVTRARSRRSTRAASNLPNKER